MIRLDTTGLTDLINRCFTYGTDPRVSQDAQSAFLAGGKRLRGLLLNLISAQFHDRTQAVLEANQEIVNLNTRLSNPNVTLANLPASLGAIASIILSLDKLLDVAAAYL